MGDQSGRMISIRARVDDVVINVFSIYCMSNLYFVCVVPLSEPSSRDLLCVNVCVVPLSEPSSRDLLCVNVCVVPLSEPSSRDLVCPLWDLQYPREKNI